jgi:hypothetical protein
MRENGRRGNGALKKIGQIERGRSLVTFAHELGSFEAVQITAGSSEAKMREREIASPNGIDDRLSKTSHLKSFHFNKSECL